MHRMFSSKYSCVAHNIAIEALLCAQLFHETHVEDVVIKTQLFEQLLDGSCDEDANDTNKV